MGSDAAATIIYGFSFAGEGHWNDPNPEYEQDSEKWLARHQGIEVPEEDYGPANANAYRILLDIYRGVWYTSLGLDNMTFFGRNQVKFQDIQTKQAGLPCEIRVLNHSGDDVLTTYDPADAASVTVAQQDLAKFFQDCIREFNGYEPLIYGMPCGDDGGSEGPTEGIIVDPLAPDFDLASFSGGLTILPPIIGG